VSEGYSIIIDSLEVGPVSQWVKTHLPPAMLAVERTLTGCLGVASVDLTFFLVVALVYSVDFTPSAIMKYPFFLSSSS
jgi:hypothetical protein